MVEETPVQRVEVQNVLVVKMKKKQKIAKIKTKIEKHPWDETMVISVLVVAALAILMILASYISVTGEASSMPTKEGSLDVLKKSTVIEDSGRTKCSIKCKNEGKVCILAHLNENIAKCDEIISGDYHCLCTNIERII
jgi:hypothetical protein